MILKFHTYAIPSIVIINDRVADYNTLGRTSVEFQFNHFF